MRFLLILALLLTACKPTAVAPPLAPALGWTLRYGSGTVMQGNTFAIPPAPGSVNYVTTPIAQASGTMTLTFRVNSTAPFYALTDTTSYGAPQIHLFLERSGDEALTNEYGRWWCGSSAYVLGADDDQTVSISCPLVWTSWTDVYGHQDAAQFQDALNHLQWGGFTFGGASGWGHGVYMQGGTAQVQIENFTVQ